MPGKLIPLALLVATLGIAGCSVQHKGSNGNEDVKIDTPFGGMKVKTNDAVAASELGVPVYPGSTAIKQKGDDKGAADVDMSFGSFHLRVKAASYHTDDPVDKVTAFYRDKLGRYGDVIECKDDHPVAGSPAKTSEGLSCGDDKHINVDGKKMNADVELKAGGNIHQHIVAVEKESGGTKFSLFALDLPKIVEKEEDKQSN